MTPTTRHKESAGSSLFDLSFQTVRGHAPTVGSWAGEWAELSSRHDPEPEATKYLILSEGEKRTAESASALPMCQAQFSALDTNSSQRGHTVRTLSNGEKE